MVEDSIKFVDTELAELAKQVCAVCDGFGHTHSCYRKSKKKTKLGCPSFDTISDWAVSKLIPGHVLDAIVKKLAGEHKVEFKLGFIDIDFIQEDYPDYADVVYSSVRKTKPDQSEKEEDS